MYGALLATCTRNTCFHSNSSMAEKPNSSIATDPWQKGLTLTTHLSSGLTVWQPLLSYQKAEFSEHFQQLTSKKLDWGVKTVPAALQIRRRTFSPGRENPRTPAPTLTRWLSVAQVRNWANAPQCFGYGDVR